MPDDIGEASSNRPTARRAATNPSVAMDDPAQDREPPRVRFSEDVARDHTAAYTDQQHGIPHLTLDTDQDRSGSLRVPASDSRNRSPGRQRGYSLRSALFRRALNSPPEGSSPIEITEAPSADTEGESRRLEEGKATKLLPSGIAVAPVLDDEIAVQHTDQDAEPSVLSSRPESTLGKRSSGALSLPNYTSWASRRHRRKGLAKTLDSWREYFVRLVQQGKEPLSSGDGRHIDLDASRKADLLDVRTGKPYVGNVIRSSRYTLWNFIPRQLFFQFSKLANAYFLTVSVLQMIPGFSTTGNYTTIAPLLVFVCISMGKEGWDDVRRYKLDKVENNSEALVLYADGPLPGTELKSTKGGRRVGISRKSPKEVKTQGTAIIDEPGLDIAPVATGPKIWASLKWQDIKVGNIIKLERDDPVPADMVLIYADGPNGVAYIDTMALDGETNLKSKQAPPPLAQRCTTAEDVAKCRASIVAEDPNLDLYHFDGRITIDGETLPLTTTEIVFRGSTVRNTNCLIGMVINTGEETKIRMNATKNPRIKSPEIQNITNHIIIILVVFVILLSLFCTIAYQIWSKRTESKSFYLDNAHVPFYQILIGFIILYNTLIPLSLYVSLEIIKVGQLFFITDDIEMYDPVSDTPMKVNTTTILENLGQVDYVFSDKTGTLTDNVMRFRKLSVGGYAWLHDFDLQEEAGLLQHNQDGPQTHLDKGKGRARWTATGKRTKPEIGKRKNSEMTNTDTSGMSVVSKQGSLWKSSARPGAPQPELRTEDLLKYMQHKPHSIFTKKAKFFLLSLALCHTCLPELTEDGIDFQAASPDELALVKAAQELGYLVIDRPAKCITLSYPGGPGSTENVTESYEVLDVIEFSSKRKRMSIIVKFPDGRICIFCKGADSTLLPRLKNAPLALQSQSVVKRRASQKRSLEAEQALRRMSEQGISPRNSVSVSITRPSISIQRPSMSHRRSIGAGRPSMASSRLQPIRDGLDSWLRDRESDVESITSPEDTSAYNTPRTSMHRVSLSMDRRYSTQVEDHVDDMVDEALVLDNEAVFQRTFQHIDDFATEGLRTLLFGYRFLDEQEYQGWKKIYLDATTSLVDRQKMIESAGEIIEQNLDLAGASAIEDKLQKGVPQTIDKLRRANIKIWMLTGDKRETAINIAQSARLCKSYSQIVILDHTTGEVEQRMASTLLDITKGAIAHSVIVVDGQTLAEIDADETLGLLFFDLVVLADSVICCRASPSQKASLVKRVRTKVTKSVTLAIGDGANDIAMIQEAHVGIGISGKEGLQASRISDYSIAQFRFLQRLLLVHGRWNYVRTGKYILATFWKETMFYLIQAFYTQWAAYSGTSLFESTSLTVFNTLFTSLCVIFLGVFEQDLEASTLLAVPELYMQGQRNEAFNIKKYIAWTFMAVCEAAIIYFTMYGLFGNIPWQRDVDLMAIGTLCFTGGIVLINFKLLYLEFHHKTIVPLIGFCVSIGGWFLWTAVLSVIFVPKSEVAYPLYPIYQGFWRYYGRSLTWWAVLFLAMVSVFVLESAESAIRKFFWPTDTEVFQELQKDAIIRKRFEDAAAKSDSDALDVEGDPTKVKSSIDSKAREQEIVDLLARPRQDIGSVGGTWEVVRSPIDVEGGVGLGRSVSGGTGRLRNRKASVDREREEIEMNTRGSISAATKGKADGVRHSIDVVGR